MKNDQTNDNPENLQAIFSEVRSKDFSAPPFMKTRVLAHVREVQMQRKQLFFWKALSSFAVAALVVVSLVTVQMSQKSTPDIVTNQVYVIHVDFNQDDQARVAQAEVELPEGVHFESKRPEIRNLRKLKLPVNIGAIGRAKLPFVLSSTSAGEKAIKVRLLDDGDQVVREQVMSFKFAQVSGPGERL